MSKFTLQEIRGVIPALMTCFDAEENIDEKAQRALVDHLLAAGVDGFYTTGSTGAAFTMTDAERMRVAEIIVDQVAGRVPVIVHIGAIGTKRSIALAQHAESIGADAISSVPPFYWGFSPENVYNYYRDIALASQLPMVIYNIALAGTINKELLLRLAQLDNIQGLKYTARTHDEMGAIKRELGPDFRIYSGCDEMALSGLNFGADGLIGSFYNVIPELYLALYQAAQAGDMALARSLQEVGDDFIFETLKYNLPSVFHTLLKWRGLEAGQSRRPFKIYQEADLQELKQNLKKLVEKSGQAQYFSAFKNA